MPRLNTNPAFPRPISAISRLEAAAAVARPTRLPEVVVNDLNPFLGLTQTPLLDRRAGIAARCSPDAGGLGQQSTAERKCRPAWRDAPSLPDFPTFILGGP